LAIISHPTKSYLRNNILSGTPGHKGYSEKAVTIFEIARLSLREKLDAFVHTQNKNFCVFYWEKWKNVRMLSAMRNVLQNHHCRYVFSTTKSNKRCCQLLCCLRLDDKNTRKNAEKRDKYFI
jgi:hypothetical protein